MLSALISTHTREGKCLHRVVNLATWHMGVCYGIHEDIKQSSQLERFEVSFIITANQLT